MLDLSFTSLRSLLSFLHIPYYLSHSHKSLNNTSSSSTRDLSFQTQNQMSSPNPYTKHPSPPPRSTVAATPASGGGFLCKSVLVGMFLVALPLFPSQAPDFVGETVLTKFWELIHLMFVGIAVAYGLFSRRNVESNVELRMSCVDESSLSYVSRILQVPSVFDNEEEEEEVDSSYESGRASVVVNKSEYGGEINQVQAWNSQYFQGRSKVVVARPAYGLDGHVVHQSLGLPVRSLRSAIEENEKAEEGFDEVMAAAPSSPWHSSPEMMAMEEDSTSNFQLDETRFATRSSRSSVSSSQTGFESNDQKTRFSPSRSVSEESLNSNTEESVKEKSLQGSPSLPPSPTLSPAPELVTDDTHRLVVHSRHYSDGSLLEEDLRRGFKDELEEGSKVRGFSKKGPGSKSLKLTAESSRKEKNKSSRRSPVDHSTTRRRYLQQKSDSHLFDESVGKRLESDHNKLSVNKARSHDSFEFQPTNDKPSEDYDKSRKKDLPGDNKTSSPRGKSVRTIRSDRNHGDSSDDWTESHGRNKPRRKWQQELAIVLHQEKHSEPEDEDDDDVMEETEAEQPEVTLEEEEEEVAAAWERQSNASHEHYEVDRKADEFIAKFREQIRLQKLHSGEQRRGGGTGIIRNTHFR